VGDPDAKGRDIVEGVSIGTVLARVRLVESDPPYARMVNRPFDKVRQAARGMSAVIIRMVDALSNLMEETRSSAHRRIRIRQAEMVMLKAKSRCPIPTTWRIFAVATNGSV
jgi:uncharacterized membrane protein